MEKKLKRCPNGTRRNKKTGECEPTKIVKEKKVQKKHQDKSKEALKQKNPNGVQRNKKTAKCEPTKIVKEKTVAKPAMYHFIKKLGEGGIGEVFLLGDDKGNKYALKTGSADVLSKQYSVLQRLRKKNICNHFLCPIGFRVNDNKGYIYMEYLENYIDLSDIIKGDYFINARNLIQLRKNIYESLTLLHENNIVHSDIKPANIMVKVNPVTKEVLPESRIIDVGAAIKKTSNGKNMKIHTFTRKYFDFSLIFPGQPVQKIPNLSVFSRNYTFDELKQLDNSALRKVFHEMGKIKTISPVVHLKKKK
jgi:serine/threonine protein kinase